SGARRASHAVVLKLHAQAETARKLFDGLREGQAVEFHEKGDDRAVRAAAEAVIKLFDRADPERRGLVVVKETAGLVLVAGFLERHAIADELDDVGARQQLIDERLGDPTGHRGSLGAPRNLS